jgi:hypothetical protein
MTYYDTDVVSEVLEQTQASHALEERMREMILARLTARGQDPAQELRHLFEELVASGSRTIK